MLSPGCRVHGRVVSSVLSPGVIVEEGAEVHESVVLHDVVVKRGASVQTAIVDAEVEIGEGATVGQTRPSSRARGGSSDVSADEIAVVGMRAAIKKGARVPPGERVDPATTVR